MGRADEQNGETRQEALRILYRLRADCAKKENTPPHVLQAIESLIELMHFEIDEYLRSGGGRRKSRFAQWCREHGR